MKVIFSPLAEEKLLELVDYLMNKWNYKVKQVFVTKLKAKIEQIERFPESCALFEESKGLYRCVITEQTSIYYRIQPKTDSIEIVVLFDTRQNSEKLKKFK